MRKVRLLLTVLVNVIFLPHASTILFASISTQSTMCSLKEVSSVPSPKGAVLYIAIKGGNIMSIELDIPDKKIVDTGVSAGGHPFELLFDEEEKLLYVVDAGVQIGYIGDPVGLGDGEIFVMGYDDNTRLYVGQTVLENKGGDAYEDPHYAYIDREEKLIYFADRGEGIRRIPLSTRDAKLEGYTYPYWIQNARIGYYGNGISFRNTNGPLFEYNGLWH